MSPHLPEAGSVPTSRSSEIASIVELNGYGSGLVPFLGGCRGVTVVGGLGWVDLAVLGCEPPEAVLLCPAEGSGGVGNEAVWQGCKDGSSFA